jgi:hypothetical protein
LANKILIITEKLGNHADILFRTCGIVRLCNSLAVLNELLEDGHVHWPKDVTVGHG